MPKLEKTEFNVEVQALGEQSQPVVITQSEYMRRMKDMSRYQQGMSFYGQMPDSYSIVLNSKHPLIKRVLDDVKDKEKDKVAEYAKGNPVVSQLIDLALLQNGMLKGAALDTFLKRSVELIK
jgi:molecular chaperone HtpG